MRVERARAERERQEQERLVREREEERERGAARVDRDGVADTMVREADRIMRETDGFAREVDVEGSRVWQLVYRSIGKQQG